MCYNIGMKEIELTQNQRAIIDDKDAQIVVSYTWYAHHKWGRWEALTAIIWQGKRQSLSMGRMLLGLMPGNQQRMEYINGDKLDNRRANLRIEKKNQIIIIGEMVRIDVGKGKITLVDKNKYDLVKGYTWSAVRGQGSKNWYAQTNIKTDKGYTTMMMHKLLIDADYSRGEIRDHKNGNGLDNRMDNLRVCRVRDNARNQSGHVDAKWSKYKGVTFQKAATRNKRWVARIIVDYKQIYVGMFKTEIEAAKAYDMAAIKYHGEFARLNFK